MRVLGIDPGIAITGYGVVEDHSGKFKSIAYGCIITESKDSVSCRLKTIYQDLGEIIKTYRPDFIAIEELFFAANVKTAISVGEARGVIILGAANLNIPIAQYTPLQIKQGISGYGKADKKQVQYMIKNLLGLSEIPKPDDAADGLAAAICHLNSYKLNQKCNTPKVDG
ncbi:crossover junction endodeoxyribonuclease RuvC [Candidatus Poribacteria bacterium]|nr:crossover junction endodeoxyribonuclease RuvC [Candidatus Poribacteria bacterium]